LTVNCQLTFAFLVFLKFYHDSISFQTTFVLSILLFKHCHVSMFNSVTSIFSQPSCFGAYTNSNLPYIAFAFQAETFHIVIRTFVFKLSITSVIFLALSYCPIIFSIKKSLPLLCFLSVTFTVRFPDNDSQERKILRTPQRLYS